MDDDGAGEMGILRVIRRTFIRSIDCLRKKEKKRAGLEGGIARKQG